jgi:hypothetical protein
VSSLKRMRTTRRRYIVRDTYGSGDPDPHQNTTDPQHSFAHAHLFEYVQGVEGLIELENPNRVKQKMKKVSQLDDPTLGAAPAAAAAAAAPAKKAAPGEKQYRQSS